MTKKVVDRAGAIEQVLVSVDRLIESGGNPRRIFRRLESLGAGMLRDGQLEPLIVRPEPKSKGVYEVADGVRRLRAAKGVGISHLRCEVRDLSDRQMVELAFAANGDREELHPLEEAEGFRQLHEVYSATVAEIAAHQSVSTARVYGRLALCGLIAEVRDAFAADEMSTAAALQFARLVPNQQRLAWEQLAAFRPITEAEIKHFIGRQVLRSMAGARFDPKDAQLVPSAGACAACPKRTDNQQRLFEDAVSVDDSCTDPACWTAKREANLVQLRARVDARNGKFIPWPASAKFFAGGSRNVTFAAGQIEVDVPADELSDGSPVAEGRRLDALVGESVYARSVLVVDADGDPRWLIPVDDAKTALREAGHVELANRLRAPTPAQASEADEAAKKTKKNAAAIERVIVALVAEAIEPPPFPKELWQWVALVVVRLSTIAALTRVHTRRLGQAGRKVSRQDMERELLGLRARGQAFSRGLAVELAATHDAYQPDGKLFGDVCKLFVLPVAKLMAGEAIEAHDEQPKAKPKKKRVKVAKKKPSKAKKKPKP